MMSFHRKSPLLFLMFAPLACGGLDGEGEDLGGVEGDEIEAASGAEDELEATDQAVSRPANNGTYFLKRPGLNLGIASARSNGAFLVLRENYTNQARWTFQGSQIRLAGSDLCVQHQGLGAGLRLAACSRGGTRWDTTADGRIRYNGDNNQCITAQGKDQNVIVAACNNQNNRKWDWAPPPANVVRLRPWIGAYTCGYGFGVAAINCRYAGQTGRVGTGQCYIQRPSALYPNGLLGRYTAPYRCDAY